MNNGRYLSQIRPQSGCSRRQFLGGAVGAAAATPLLGGRGWFRRRTGRPAAQRRDAPKRKIKLGLVGCGGRGSWIAKLFQEHGGYQLHAVADYFPACGRPLRRRRGRATRHGGFPGLSGYKKVIESGVEAVALIVPPCFLPEHASAAAEAGLHVYMAKPVAVDVPGCLRVEAAGKLATQKTAGVSRGLPDPHRSGQYPSRRADPQGRGGKTGKDLYRRHQRRASRSAQDGQHRKPLAKAGLGQRYRPRRQFRRVVRHPCYRRRDLGPRTTSRGRNGRLAHLPASTRTATATTLARSSSSMPTDLSTNTPGCRWPTASRRTQLQVLSARPATP